MILRRAIPFVNLALVGERENIKTDMVVVFDDLFEIFFNPLRFSNTQICSMLNRGTASIVTSEMMPTAPTPPIAALKRLSEDSQT